MASERSSHVCTVLLATGRMSAAARMPATAALMPFIARRMEACVRIVRPEGKDRGGEQEAGEKERDECGEAERDGVWVGLGGSDGCAEEGGEGEEWAGESLRGSVAGEEGGLRDPVG